MLTLFRSRFTFALGFLLLAQLSYAEIDNTSQDSLQKQFNETITAPILPIIPEITPSQQSNQSPKWLKPYTASYIIYRGKKNAGTSTRTLDLNKNIWELSISSHAKVFFFKDKRTETSTFKWQSSLQPLSYYYKVKNNFKKQLTEETFDWDLNLVTGSRTKFKPWQFPLSDGLADPLSHQILIREQLILLREKESSSQLTIQQDNPITLSFNVSSKGLVKTRNYQIVAAETITTQAGDFKALKLQRIRGNRKTVFWMAQDLDFIPVKIYQEKNGHEQATMIMSQFEVFPENNNATQ